MKPIIYILLLISAHLGFAQQAVDRPLSSKKAMDAYAIKSESKIKEFFSYLELLSDPKLNAEMKAHTTNEALSLFKDSELTIDNIFEKKQASITLKTLLKQAALQKGKITLTVSDFNVMLQNQTPVQQEWQATYKLAVNENTVIITQHFFVIYEDKQFGKTTRKVWNTYLGALKVK